MITPALTLAVMCLAAYVLWSRRATWGMQWERAANINIVLQTFDLFLSWRWTNRWISEHLHDWFGLWNLENLIGHIAYLLGMCAVVLMAVSRLNMTDSQLSWFMYFRVQQPMRLAIMAMVVAFTVGHFGATYMPDMILAPSQGWLEVYWWTMLFVLFYLMAHIVRALLIVRQQNSSRKTANAYLAAVGVSALTCASFAWPWAGLETIQWLMVRAEVVAYSLAALYGWRTRVRLFTGSPLSV